MKKNKLLSTFVAVCMLMSVSLGNIYASDSIDSSSINQISEDQLTKLRDAGVAEEDISSLCQQIEVYNPTEIQIENYVKDLIVNETSREQVNYDPIDYEKTENGDSITPYGVIPYQDITQKWNDTSSLKAVSSLTDRVNSNDQTGVYYVVNSTAGYHQLTSYVSLPNLSNVNSIDRPYQMFGMSSTNGSNSMFGDIGLVYFPDKKQWKACYNVVENGIRWENYELNFTGGSNIYFHLQMYTNKAVLIVRDASTWSEVGRVEYAFKTNCVPSTFSTTKLQKQVTMAQHLVGGILNVNTGTRMNNAKYSQTWLYTPGGANYSFSPTYCSEAYRQGPTAAAYKKVTATPTPWSADSVSISFN